MAEIKAELGCGAISRACSMAWVYFCVKALFGGLPSPLQTAREELFLSPSLEQGSVLGQFYVSVHTSVKLFSGA